MIYAPSVSIVVYLQRDAHMDKRFKVHRYWLETEHFIYIYIYVTLDHKSSLKSLGYICNNSQQYIVWVKIIDFSFMPKIFRILSKDHGSMKIFCKFPTVNISKLHLDNFKGDFLNI